MREIKDYKIIVSQDPGSHADLINVLLKSGYEFHGEIKAVPPVNKEDLYSCLISELILYKS